MNKLADISNYHDLSGLAQLKADSKNIDGEKEALKKAAQHFESIFIGMMLKSMREANAVFEQGNPMHSNTTKFFRDMYDQQLSTNMSETGSMGLADIIVQQLSNDNKQYTNANLLRNDSDFSQLTATISKPEMASLSPSQQLIEPFKQPLDKTLSQLAQSTPMSKPESSSDKVIKPEPIDFKDPDDFVSKIWDYAKSASSKIGLNPAVMIAQSALETGWGKYIIKDQQGGSSFNLFNVKAHRDWQGEKAAQSTLEFEQGVAVRKTEPFRVYNNFTEAFDDFVNFLQGHSRYQDALDNASQPEQFLQKLQKAGYATDPNYADKIIKILNSDKFKQSISQLGSAQQSHIGA